MKLPKLAPERMRQYLLTFTVCLSYFVFVIFGIIITKYNIEVVKYVDLFFIPVGLSTILFLYLFALTYEQKIALKLNEKVKRCAVLYGEGNSFAEIKEKLGLGNVSEVKRLLTQFCKVKG